MLSTLPKYKYHKEVQAIKIAALQPLENGGLRIIPVDGRYLAFDVEPEFVPLHRPGRPEVGWYFVQYENGYKSFSPADVFEDGYTPMPMASRPDLQRAARFRDSVVGQGRGFWNKDFDARLAEEFAQVRQEKS